MTIGNDSLVNNLLPSVDVYTVVRAIAHEIGVHDVVLHHAASKYDCTTVFRTHGHTVDAPDVLRTTTDQKLGKTLSHSKERQEAGLGRRPERGRGQDQVS